MLKREASGGPTTPEFCTQCGTRMGDGQFCPHCGALAIPDDLTSDAGPFERSRAAARAASDAVDAGVIREPPGLAEAETLTGELPSTPGALGTRAPAPAAPQRGPRRWIVAAVAAGVLVVAGGVVAIVLTSRGSGPTSAYGQKLAAVFSPVVSDNRSLSSALGGLQGRNVSGAQSVTSQAQNDTTRAQGALGALSTPAGSEQVAANARQALDREQTYLGAVSAVLSDPSNPSVSQLQTLAGNLTTALDAVGSPLAGASQSVSGAESLTAWANRAAQQQQSSNNSSNSGQQSSSSGSSQQSSGQQTQAGPFANGRDCGGGLFAGPNTSCAFAQNVRSAYDAAPGLVTTVSVFSPVTGQTYEMSCAPAGSGVTCSGGNNASVSWTG